MDNEIKGQECINERTPLIRIDHGKHTTKPEIYECGQSCFKLCSYHPKILWHPSWHFSVSGSVNTMIYFWILKDFFWSQDSYYSGLTFGCLSLIWCIYLLCLAIYHCNYHEVWQGIGQFLWLFANFWWMTGELYCSKNCFGDYTVYESHSDECGYIMILAFIWLAIFYIIVLPLNLLPLSTAAKEAYDEMSLSSPYPYLFSTWREYENVHMILWLGKDCAWNHMNIIMWYIFLIPTLLVAVDYVLNSAQHKDMLIEMSHYCAVLFWVCANAAWAVCDFYRAGDDYPRTRAISVWTWTPEATENYRWRASLMFLLSLLPLVCLYAIWWPLSLYKRLTSVSVFSPVHSTV
eukprot:gene3882-7751_t